MRIIPAIAVVLLYSGCATLERAIDGDPGHPCFEKAFEPNVWVRVPKALVDGLQEAIVVSGHWAAEHCDEGTPTAAHTSSPRKPSSRTKASTR